MVNICGELTWLGLRRPFHGAVAPTPGDNSGWQEDHRTTENTEITERRTQEGPKQMNLIEGGQINWITERIIGAAIEVHRALGPGLLESTY